LRRPGRLGWKSRAISTGAKKRGNGKSRVTVSQRLAVTSDMFFLGAGGTKVRTSNTASEAISTGAKKWENGKSRVTVGQRLAVTGDMFFLGAGGTKVRTSNTTSELDPGCCQPGLTLDWIQFQPTLPRQKSGNDQQRHQHPGDGHDGGQSLVEAVIMQANT